MRTAATVTAPFRMSRVGRHAVVYGAGVLLNKAVAFIMLPIYTRFLTPADYGVLQLVIMTIEVVSIVAGSRLAGGVFHYYHKAEEERDRRAVLSTALWLLAASYTVVGLATLALAPGITVLVFGAADQTALVRIAAAAFALESLIIVPLAFFQLRDRSVTFIAVNAGKLLLHVALNLWFVVHLGMAAKGVLMSVLIGNAIVGGVLAGSLVRQVGVRVSRRTVRDLLRFGLPLVATQVATFVVTYGDRYFLQRSVGEAGVGIYGLAYQFGFLLAALGHLPFKTVWDPVQFEIAKRPDRDELFARGFVYLNLLLITMAAGIALFVGDFLRIIADPEFHAAAVLVPIILVAYVLQAWSDYQSIGTLVRERTEYFTVANWVSAVVAVAAYLMLIPRWGGLGAAVATVLAFVARSVLVLVFSQRLWPLRYRWGPVVRLVGIAAAVIVAGIIMPPMSLWLSIVAHGALFGAYLAAVWALGILSEEERGAVVRAVRSPRLGVAALLGRPLVGAD